MLECGFTVKSQVYIKGKSNTKTRDYTSIICPIDLPSAIVLKLIRSMLHANGGNRLGGSITESDFNITEDPNVVVKGYWATKSNSATSTTTAQPSSTPTTSYKPPAKPIAASATVPTATAKTSTPVVVQGPWAEKKKALNTSADDGTPKPPVVQGYWASKKEKPVVSGSLFDNDDGQPGEVLTGYWGKKKEERKIGSIWDDE